MIGRNRSPRSLVRALLAVLGLLLAAPVLSAAEAEPALAGVVNVNTATVEELQLLPGVGEVRALAIVEARKQNGGFKRVDDLLGVTGIGSTSLERLRPFVTVQGKTTARLR